jgi:hypothetical protein
MRTLFVILAILIAGSVYADSTPTKRIGCWGVNSDISFKDISAFMGEGNANAGTVNKTISTSNNAAGTGLGSENNPNPVDSK